MMDRMTVAELNFRDLCAEHGIAMTEQRRVLYEVMLSMPGHPSPEEVYAKVRERIPAISLATVYKNIHLFVESGVLSQVSVHHGSQRVEMNEREHHHLVCSRCKAIEDIELDALGDDDVALPRRGLLPSGFLVQRCSVDVIGLCRACQGLAAGGAPAIARPSAFQVETA
jgi:Fur family peroxide stress response transcriptional regulator